MTGVPSDAEAQWGEAVGALGEPDPPADAETATESEPDTDSEAGAEASGVPAADDAAARLRDLDDAPVEEHVEIYEDAHRRLEEGLADLDEQ